MSAWATATDLAGLPGLPASAFRIREVLTRLSVPSRRRAGRGGGVEFAVAALPEHTRLAFVQRCGADAQVSANDARLASVPPQASARAEEARQAALVTGWRKDRQDEVARVLVAFQRFWAGFGGPVTPALHAFCSLWAAGKVPADEALRTAYPRLSFSTLRGWYVAVERGGLAEITPPKHWRKGQFSALAGEVGHAVLALLIDKPHLSAQAIYRVLQAQFAGLPSDRAFRRGLAAWKTHNAQLLAGLTNPDAWRSRYMSAAGSASAAVTKPNQLWEMDSTPGDVMLADGKRHAVIAVIDVYTRRRMFLVARTSKSGAIMALIRRAIAAWGVPEAIKTDNGQDYTARQLDQALVGLGIEHPLCTPFSPHQKPHVERCIGALMREHFELLDGFIGHNVAQRQDIEARRSFAERLFDADGSTELRLSPEQLQDTLDAYCTRREAQPEEALGGMTPLQAAAGFSSATVSERALDILLAPAADGGTRVVGKKGIRIGRGDYNHAALGGLEGSTVQVKVDDANLGRCWVFDLDGIYLCEAIDHARLGISAAEVAAERKAEQARKMREAKRRIKAETREYDTRAAVQAITHRRVQQAVEASPNVVALRPQREHTSTAIESIDAAGVDLVTAAQVASSQQVVAARLAAVPAPAVAPAQVLRLDDTPQLRYARWVRLEQRVQRGQALTPAEGTWFQGYPAGAEHRSMRDYFERFGLDAETVLAGAG